MKLVRHIALTALVLTVALAAAEGLSPRGLPSIPVMSWMEAGDQVQSAILKVGQLAVRKVVERAVPAFPPHDSRSYRLGTVQMLCWDNGSLPHKALVLICPVHGAEYEAAPAAFPPTRDFAAPPTPVRAEVVALSSEHI